MGRMDVHLHLLFILFIVNHVTGLGCMPKICDGNDLNQLRRCPDGDNSCGEFNGIRSTGQIVEAVDIRCEENKAVHAPFDGEMFYWKPFGGNKDRKCADQGVKIEGTGQWQGYTAYISSLDLDIYGGTVKSGDVIGRAKIRNCWEEEHQRQTQPHIEFKLTKEGRVVDPTYHLQDCMCTGQVCESNKANRMLGPPFKSDRRYNGVRGWDIECQMIEDEDEREKPRAPLIYAPITGEVLGRARITFDNTGSYSGCDNDAMFIVGTGAWIDFEVRLYNVRYRADLGFGRKRIVQGEPIGTRLNCENSPDSVFLEVRYQGRVVDITDMITADKCKLPSFLD